MNCPSCGHPNLENNKFCGACGRPLSVVCASCGSPTSPDQKFCGACGAALGGGAPGAVPGAPERAQAPAPEGERRHATVVFSDLSGYTALNERLDPEEVSGLMARIKARAVEIVESHGGIVNQFVGDEIVALFGIPSAHEDDPVRAVHAALELHDLVRRMSQEAETRIGHPLRLHSGISTGLVVTSLRDRRDGTVGITGDTVNLGARLAGHAPSDAILLAPDTQRLVAGFFETERLAPVTLKGKAGPTVPYQVKGAKGIGTRFEAAVSRGLTPFTGREAELATLRKCLERALTGNGQFLTVLGEAGIGKSRLLHEFRQGIDRDQVTILEGRCQSYGKETPYLPLLDALRRGLRLLDETDPVAVHEKAVANILAIDPELERYLPHLLHLLSIPSERHQLPANLAGDALRRQLEEALGAIVTLNTRHRPMVVIYEDWHWADEASDTALNNLIGLVGQYPLLLVVLYRPDYARKWSEMEHYSAIVLHALDVPHTEAMLRAVLGVELLPEGLGATVHARTGGNALFNEEIAHALREERMIETADGQARLTRPLEALRLPESIHAVIRARVDRLDPNDREILRLASVIGREFDRGVLEQVAAQREQVGRALERLARLDLVRPQRLLPQAEYIFKHVLTQAVVYETLLLQQRKELHARIGQAIEAQYAALLEEHYEALAHHYSQSEEAEKAVEYLEKAGDKAVGYSAVRDAINYYSQAIGRLDAQGITPERIRHQIDITLKLAEVAVTSPSAQLFEFVDRAADLARQSGDTLRQMWVSFFQGQIRWIVGDLTNGHRYLLESVRMAEAIHDERCLGLACRDLGQVVLYLGAIREGIAHCERALLSLDRTGASGRDRARVRWLLGFLHGFLGNFAEAFEYGQEALEIARGASDRFEEAWALFFLGYTHCNRGNWEQCMELAGQAASHFAMMQVPFGVGHSTAWKGIALFWSAKGEQGLRLIREGLNTLEAGGTKLGLTVYYGAIAEMHSLAAHREEGASSGRHAEEVHGASGETLGLPICDRGLALLAAYADSPDWKQAEERIGEAVREYQARSQRPELAVTRLRHAEIVHKKGDLDRALEQVAEAERLFREMEMTWWLGQAQALRGRIERREKFVWFAPYVDGPPKV
jgi:class 3 adenylate cyclase/tetratricopeptide (TPR) repeat protein